MSRVSGKNKFMGPSIKYVIKIWTKLDNLFSQNMALVSDTIVTLLDLFTNQLSDVIIWLYHACIARVISDVSDQLKRKIKTVFIYRNL